MPRLWDQEVPRRTQHRRDAPAALAIPLRLQLPRHQQGQAPQPLWIRISSARPILRSASRSGGTGYPFL